MSEEKAKYVPTDQVAEVSDAALVRSIQIAIEQLNTLTDVALEQGIAIEIETVQKSDPYDAKLSVTKFVLRSAMRKLFTPIVLVPRS